jgi:hypothetical protein
VANSIDNGVDDDGANAGRLPRKLHRKRLTHETLATVRANEKTRAYCLDPRGTFELGPDGSEE